MVVRTLALVVALSCSAVVVLLVGTSWAVVVTLRVRAVPVAAMAASLTVAAAVAIVAAAVALSVAGAVAVALTAVASTPAAVSAVVLLMGTGAVPAGRPMTRAATVALVATLGLLAAIESSIAVTESILLLGEPSMLIVAVATTVLVSARRCVFGRVA